MPANPTDTAPQAALLAIHDVMPHTLDEVVEIIRLCQAQQLQPLTLLVVPGLPWQPAQLATLKALAAEGHSLAGHGWLHRVARIRGIKHRLHSLFISRNVAEHLACDSAGIARLITACHAWFAEQGLPSPSLYVPPAWAMGRIARAELQRLPFRRYETLHGLYDADSNHFHPLPVIGFEADTAWRVPPLRLANAINTWRARRGPLRIAIHPHDLQYQLAQTLRNWLARPLQCLDYADI